MPFSMRLDPETEALIQRMAARTGQSRASVVREAVVSYAASAEEGLSAYDRLQSLVGVMRSGRSDLSQRTGDKLAALLKERQVIRARRSR